ncbi:DUF2341 domain-containing protein [Candidatus Woesearchaeota archaeon]|nr:MAG: DUF2341 domain-containing protein [Candidatus Woesearchaeota archaeon]
MSAQHVKSTRRGSSSSIRPPRKKTAARSTTREKTKKRRERTATKKPPSRHQATKPTQTPRATLTPTTNHSRLFKTLVFKNITTKILPLIIIALIASPLFFIPPAASFTRLEKTVFTQGELVRVNLHDLPSTTRIKIIHGENVLRYTGSPNTTTLFNPPEPGAYQLIIEDSSGRELERHTFTVTNATQLRTNSSSQSTQANGQTQHANAHLLVEPLATTTGNPITITVARAPPQATLILKTNNTYQRYLGDLNEPITLYPEEPALYELELRLGNHLLEQTNITVLPNPAKTAKETSAKETRNNPALETTQPHRTPQQPSTPQPSNSNQPTQPFQKTPRKPTLPTQPTRATPPLASFEPEPLQMRYKKAGHTISPTQLTPGERYDLEILPTKGAFQTLTFASLEHNPQAKLYLDEDQHVVFAKGERLTNLLALDPSQLTYTTATLTRTAKGNALYKCTAWNFQTATCESTWEKQRSLTPGETYTITITPQDPAFGESLPWWNNDYTYRRQINISNIATEGLSQGYPVKLVLNTQALVSQGKARADLDDLRVLWYNDSSATWNEINREIIDPNTTATRVWFRTQTPLTAENYSYFIYYGNPSASNPPENASVILNLSAYTLSSYGGTAQDVDSTSNNLTDRTLHLYGNSWKALNYPYTVTTSTILELDFRNRYNGSEEQEINGIGLETQTASLSSNRFFQLYGTQVFGFQTYHNYTSPNWTHYVINVSADMVTGSYSYLTFGSDEDADDNGPPPDVPDGWFSNIILREAASKEPTLSLGEEIYYNAKVPLVTLNTPPNASSQQGGSVTFNCSAESLAGQDIINITLYHNITGSWQANQTQTFSGSSDTNVSATFTLTNLTEGVYIWNCFAVNNESNSSFATNNYTFIVDTTFPVITIHTPQGLVKDSTPTINASFSETVNAWYSVNGGTNKTLCTACTDGFVFEDVEAEGSYTLTVYANDTAGNLASNTSSFTVDMNKSYYDAYPDNSSIASSTNVTFTPGSLTFSGTITLLFNETFADGSTTDGSPVTWVEVNEGVADNTPLWVLTGGYFAETGNAYDAVGNRDTIAKGTYQYAQGINVTNFNLTAKLYAGDNDGMGLMFRYVNQTNYYRVRFEGTSNYRRLEKVVNDSVTVLDSDTLTDGGLTQNAWHTVTVIAEGNTIEVYLDGTLVLNATDTAHAAGSIALYSWGMSDARFDNVTLSSLGPKTGRVISTRINTTNYISAITPEWTTNNTDAQNNITLWVSVDGGATYHAAQQGVEINSTSYPSFTPGRSFLFVANYTSPARQAIAITSVNFTWKEEDFPPIVSLDAPSNSAFIEQEPFTLNCSATDNNDIVNITLYLNTSGTLQPSQTQTFPGTNDTSANASFTVTSLTDGTYLWTCAAADNNSLSFASENGTFTLDTRNLSITETLTPSITFGGDNVTVTGKASLTDGSNATNATLTITIDGVPLNESNLIAQNVHADPWWNYSWNYRIKITIDFSSANINDYPVIQTVNFTEELAKKGITGSFDNNSVRVIEYSGQTILGEVPSQFEPKNTYNETTNAYADIIWVANGTNTATRTYYLYFDTTNHGTKQDPGYPVLRLHHNGFEESTTFTSYQGVAGAQDIEPSNWQYNTSIYAEGSRSFHIFGNTWKREDITPISLTENTTMTVRMYIPSEGEIEGIGLDNSSDNTGTTELNYIMAGCQWSGGSCGDWTEDIERYHSTSTNQWRVFAIPIGSDWNTDNGGYAPVDAIHYFNDDDTAIGGEVIYDDVAIWSVVVNLTNETPSFTQETVESLFQTDGQGNYNYTFSSPTTSGTYAVTVNVTFANKEATNTSNLTVDNDGPTITQHYPSSQEVVYSSTVNFNWTANDAQAWALCDLIVDGAVQQANINSTTGTPTNYTVPGLTNGNHTWQVNCTDSLGNLGSSAITPFNVSLFVTLSIDTNGTEFTKGKIVNITINLTNQGGDVVNATVHTKVIKATYEFDWWNENWTYRTPVTIQENSGNNLTEYQVNVTIDTQALISSGKLNSDCSDLRAVDSSGNLLDFYIEENPTYTCNTSATTIWVKASALNASTTSYLFLYYGNPSATTSQSLMNETFSYSTKQSIYYVVDSFAATTSTVSVTPFYNGTSVQAGTTSLSLNKGDVGLISNTQLTQAGAITTDKPVQPTHDGEGDALVPISFAGTTFVYRIDRSSGSNVNTFHILAPFNDTSVQIFYGTNWGTLLESHNITKGNVVSTTTDTPNNVAVLISASAPVLVFHVESGQGDDAFPFYPATTDWWGVPSGSIEIAALENGTTATIYWSDTATPTTVSLDAGDEHISGGHGTQGSAPAAHVVSNKPIGVKQIADGDGTESVTFLPESELAKEYVFSHDSSYVAIAATQPDTSCTIYSSTGTLLFSGTGGSNARPRPNQILFGDGAGPDIPAGSFLNCSAPVYAYAEYDTGDEEQNLWNPKQHRKLAWPAPSVATDSEEELLYTNDNDTGATGFIIPHNTSLYDFGTFFAWSESLPSPDTNDTAKNHTSWKVIDDSAPIIENLTATPDPVGFGYTTNLSADVTDETGIASVTFNITKPDGTTLSVTPTYAGGNTYWYVFNDTWTYGDHTFLVSATDVSTQTSTANTTFFVGADAAMSVVTLQDGYGPNEVVYLVGKEDNSTWWNQNYAYRKSINLTEQSGTNLGEFHVSITLDTQALQAQNKLRGDCADVRFTDANQTEIPYYRLDVPAYACGTNQTLFFVKTNLSANENKTIYLYYNYPAAIDASSESATFNFTTNQSLFFVVSNQTPLGNLDVVSFADNNTITHNAASLTLDESKTGSFTTPARGPISANSAFFAAGDADATDAAAPLLFAAQEFAVSSSRGTDRWSIYSPYNDSTVCFYNGDGTSLTLISSCVNVPQGTTADVERDLNSLSASNSNGGYINATAPVIITHRAQSGTSIYDAYVLPPPGRRLYGVPGTDFQVAAAQDNTNVNVYLSNGTTYTFTLNQGSGKHFDVGDNYGQGPAYYVEADKPVWAVQIADGNGGEATTFLPDLYLANTYAIPHGYDYITISAPNETTCTLYDTNGNLVDQATASRTGTGKSPYKILFSARTSGAGDTIRCDKPVWVAYQEAATNDEKNALGQALYRKIPTTPPLQTEGGVEARPSESTLKNVGAYSFKGYLVMQTEYYTGGSWQRSGLPVVDDLATSNERTFTPGSILYLNQTWADGGAWDTALNPSGTYRVAARLYDPDGNLLNISTSEYFMATYNFSILSPNLTIENITHENLYEHAINEFEVEDILDWVNVTARNENATALNTSIYLRILNPDQTPAGWGPDSEKNCGDLAPGATCTKQWNNASNGYYIPFDAATGTYNMLWETTFSGTNFQDKTSSNFTFKLHRLTDEFSATINPGKVNKNDSAIYEFGMVNLWSKNLTDLNVSINCPQAPGITCTCLNTTLPYCNLTSLEGSSQEDPWFNNTWQYRTKINLTNNEASTLQAGYSVNVTIDTATLYSAGKVQLDCDDVRIVWKNTTSGELKELDRHLSTACNSATSTFWFKLQEDIPATSSDQHYYVYYGNPSVGPGPENYSNVYFFYDDFEDGDINGWQNYSSGVVQHTTTGGDNVILKTASNDPNGGYRTFPSTIDDFEVTFNFNRPNENGGAQSRYAISNSAFSGYGFRITDVNPSGTFAIEERNAGSSAGDIASTSTTYFNLNTWYHIRHRKLGSTHNITVFNSTGGYLDSLEASDLTVTSGFDRFVIHGGYEYYTDDIIVRHLVTNEPTASTLGEESRDSAVQGSWFPQFNITTNDSTPIGVYTISVNVTYTNPGLETKLWTNQQPLTLQVSAPGLIAVNITSNYTKVTRTIPYDFSGFANNTNGADALNAELTWHLPQGWQVTAGSLTTTDPVLTSGERLWNNATFTPNTTSTLGTQQINLTANSTNVEGEIDAIILEVWAGMNVTLQANDTNPERNQTILLNATVLLDNGTPQGSRTVAFRDETDNLLIGSNTTDANGVAYLYYTIPETASFGAHLFNASVTSQPSKYYDAGSGTQNITIRQATSFNNITASPNPAGIGIPVTITANVSDADGIANVTITITYPNGTSVTDTMQENSGLYTYTFNDTWQLLYYNYTITVEDNTSDNTTSSPKTFLVTTQADIRVDTEQANYSQNEQVNLTGYQQPWWNESYQYRTPFNLTSSYTGQIEPNFTVMIEIDTQSLLSAHKVRADGSDLRVVWLNATNNQSVELDRVVLDFNTTTTQVWFKTPAAFTGTGANYYLYYGNENATNPPQNIEPFTYYTRMDGNTVNGNGGDLILIPYYDNTTYTITGGVSASGTLNKDQTYQNFNLPGTDNTYTITSSKPLSVFVGVLEGSNPNAWTTVMPKRMNSSGTDFRVWSYTSSGQSNIGALWIVALENNTAYEVRRTSDDTLLHNGTLNQGELFKDSTTGANETYSVTLSKPGFIVAGKADTPTSRDAQRWWVGQNGTKRDTVIWGISNNNNGLRIYNPNNAYVTADIIDVTDGTDTINAISIPPLSSHYQVLTTNDHVLKIVADNPVLVDDKYLSNANRQGDSGDYVPEADQGHMVGTRFYVHATGGSIGQQMAAVWPLFDNTAVYQNGVLLTTIATAGTPYTFNPPLDATVNITSDKPILFLFFTEESGTDYTFSVPEASSAWGGRPKTSFGEEEQAISRIRNTLAYPFRGVLFLEVQFNSSEGWITEEVIVDDAANGTVRTVQDYNILNLADIWLANGAFNTLTREDGLYRVYAAFKDVHGNVIVTNNGTPLNATAEFNILPSRVNLDMNVIKIYDVTNATNQKTDTSVLHDTGLNDTFILYTNHTYRVEFYVNTLSNSDNWTINESNVTHAGLNSTWPIDEQNNIFYRIGEVDYTGGAYTGGNVTWNTSNGGVVQPLSTVAFDYIINMTDQGLGFYPVHFSVQGSDFGEEDFSTFRLVGYETDPPGLVNSIYNITKTSIIRGQNTTVYALWDEEILTAIAEYNTTTPSLENYTVNPPYTNNWTNHTIITNSSWLKGRHAVKLYAYDLVSNINNSLQYLFFDVYRQLSLNDSFLNPNPANISSTVIIGCQVVDEGGQPAQNYLVSFYNATAFLGTNTTNATGWAVYAYNDTSPGVEEITCNITSDLASYDNVSAQNELKQNLTTKEFGVPYADNVGQSATVIHKLENVTFYALWHDNYALDYARLATEDTGTLTNDSLSAPMKLSGTQSWSNFTVQYPADAQLGLQSWIIYGNDTSGNTNQTPLGSIEVWGYAYISESNLDPSSIIQGNTTTMSCRVLDNASQAPVTGMLVSFYNSTGELGTAATNSSGWASLNFTDNSTGLETIVCNITDSAPLYYNVTPPTQASEQLNTLPPGSDITPPQALEYNLTQTQFKRGGNTTIYARWDETIQNATVFFNATTPAIENDTIPPPYTNNWTNYTFATNFSWLVGTHVAKITAQDLSNNTNNDLPYLEFNLTGTSTISWHAPIGDVPQATIDLVCNVTDEDTQEPLANYPVYFYNSTASLGSATTDAQGLATLTIDGSAYSGSEAFSCRIFNQPELFYYIGSTYQDSQTLYFDGSSPTVDLHYPLNDSTLTTTDVFFNWTATDDHASQLVCNLTLDGQVNQTGIQAQSGQPANTTIYDLASGLHTWNVTCADQAGNANTSATWQFSVIDKDLMVNGSSVTFNTTSAVENSSVTVFGTIWNIGGTNFTNVLARFYRGDPDAGGTPIGQNHTFNITAGGNVTINDTFIAQLGLNTIYLVVDPDNTIAEGDETNNKASNTLVVGFWNFFGGQTDDKLVVHDRNIENLFTWNVTNATSSNIIVADIDSVLNFTSFQAIGLDVDNNTVDDDFTDIDVHFGSTGLTDSVENTYTVAGSPVATKDMTVFDRLITTVPVANSTNSSDFQTGILWDTSDGGASYNGTQDIVFITQVNEDKPGFGGIFDYEIRVPASLRNYTGTDDRVVFYTEIP